MSGHRLALALCVALAAAGLSVPHAGRAQEASPPCRLCKSESSDASNAPPAAPLQLHVESRLDFDKIVFDGMGSALLSLSPDGVARLSGAASAAGARAMPGSVLVRGEPGRAVRIELPRSVILTGENGATIALESLSTDLPSLARIRDDGTLSFRFGGDLRLIGDSDGAFRGSIDIVVDYL